MPAMNYLCLQQPSSEAAWLLHCDSLTIVSHAHPDGNFHIRHFFPITHSENIDVINMLDGHTAEGSGQIRR